MKMSEVIAADESCDHPRPFLFRTEYLFWWMKSAPMPVLLTTDPTGGATPTAGDGTVGSSAILPG